jgi:hypothetical protein
MANGSSTSERSLGVRADRNRRCDSAERRTTAAWIRVFEPSAQPSATAPPSEVSPGPTASGTGAAQSGQSAASRSSTPTGAPIGAAIKDVVGSVSDVAIGAFLAIATLFVLIPLGAILLVLLTYRIAVLLRRQQLVVEDLIDATGDEGIKSTIPGLSQDLRQRLLEAATADYVRVQMARDAHAANQPVDAPPPRKSADAGLAGLISAIKDSAPDQAKPVFALLGALFPANGRRVASTLQLLGAPPRALGLSAEISDLSDPGRTVLGHWRRGARWPTRFGRWRQHAGSLEDR